MGEACLCQQRDQEVGGRSEGGAQGAGADGLRGHWRQVRRGQGALRQGQDAAGLSSASHAREASPEGEAGSPLPWQDYAVWLMLLSGSSGGRSVPLHTPVGLYIVCLASLQPPIDK